GDEAGSKAAAKALELMLPLMEDGREARFVFLPQGQDPDSFVREFGKAAFENLMNRAYPISDYFFEMLSKTVRPNTVATRARFVKLARPLLAQLPEGIFKEMMYQKQSQIVAVHRNIVTGEKKYYQ